MTRRYISGLLTFAATIFAVGQALALETQPGEPEFGDKVEAPCDQAVPSDEPLAAGRVVAVDRAAGRITLEFRPIPQLLLEGGTRIFLVKDPASLKALGPGDKVRFEVERNGRSYLVTRVENRN
jgi:Cu/Ag efflux protein CusF